MAQLEFDLKAPRYRWEAARGRLLDAGLGALRWAPVWIPALLLTQLLTHGLLPALTETRRLEAAELEMRTWEAELENDARATAREHRMLLDPIYRERVRKLLENGERAF